MGLLPDEPAGRDQDVLPWGRDGQGRSTEPLDVDPRIRELDSLRFHAFDQEGGSRSFRRSKEEVGGFEHALAVRARTPVPKSRQERKRLPHRHDQLVAVLGPEPRSLCAEPERELGGMNDVGTGECAVEVQVAIANHRSGDIAHATPGKKIAEGAQTSLFERNALEIELVAPCDETRDIKPRWQVLP